MSASFFFFLNCVYKLNKHDKVGTKILILCSLPSIDQSSRLVLCSYLFFNWYDQ